MLQNKTMHVTIQHLEWFNVISRSMTIQLVIPSPDIKYLLLTLEEQLNDSLYSKDLEQPRHNAMQYYLSYRVDWTLKIYKKYLKCQKFSTECHWQQKQWDEEEKKEHLSLAQFLMFVMKVCRLGDFVLKFIIGGILWNLSWNLSLWNLSSIYQWQFCSSLTCSIRTYDILRWSNLSMVQCYSYIEWLNS